MKELFVGLDWGYRHPAAVFAQEDDLGRWCILGELVLEEKDLPQFADQIFTYLKRHYPYHWYDPAVATRAARRVQFWVDPAGSFQTDLGQAIDRAEKLGIHCNYRMDARVPEMRASIIRGMLTRLIEAKPVLRVHPRCQVIVDGFEYGYHYRIARNGKVAETPNKDGYFEHIFDAVGYLFHGVYGQHASGAAKRRGQVKASVAVGSNWK
jgi:hypothetical protein